MADNLDVCNQPYRITHREAACRYECMDECVAERAKRLRIYRITHVIGLRWHHTIELDCIVLQPVGCFELAVFGNLTEVARLLPVILLEI